MEVGRGPTCRIRQILPNSANHGLPNSTESAGFDNDGFAEFSLHLDKPKSKEFAERICRNDFDDRTN